MVELLNGFIVSCFISHVSCPLSPVACSLLFVYCSLFSALFLFYLLHTPFSKALPVFEENDYTRNMPTPTTLLHLLTRRLRPRPAIVWILLVLAIGAALSPYRSPIARFIWDHTRLETAATALDRTDADLAFAIAEYYFNHGSYNVTRAKQYYTRAIALRPDFLEAHYQLARIEFIGGRFFQALEHIRAVLELDPEFKRGYYMYGLINGYNGNMIEAIRGFEGFIERDSFNWAGYNDLAWVYFQLGSFEQTLETAERGLEQAHGNPWLLNMRGLALMNLDRDPEAHAVFAEAKQATERLTPADWGTAYPGNDPAIYASGLDKMREAIEHNLALTQEKED